MTVLTGLILENKGKHACGNGIKSSIKGPKFVFSLDFSKSTVTGMTATHLLYHLVLSKPYFN